MPASFLFDAAAAFVRFNRRTARWWRIGNPRNRITVIPDGFAGAGVPRFLAKGQFLGRFRLFDYK